MRFSGIVNIFWSTLMHT